MNKIFPRRRIGAARRAGPLRAAAPALFFFLLAACGQKGPLQMPGYGKDTPWPMRRPATAGAPAANTPGGASADAATGASGAAPSGTQRPAVGTGAAGSPSGNAGNAPPAQ
jgi:predicted small lipoprotein YifL